MERRRITYFLLCFAAALALAANLARAEGSGPGTLMQWSYGESSEGGPDLDEPLVTDRPDFTESAITVGQGVVQLEIGYLYTYDDDANSSTRTHAYPLSLLRIGTLADWLELRIAWSILDQRTNEFGGPTDTATGAEDMVIAVKIALTPQECLLPETAVILRTTVPTGVSEFTADEMLPGFTYVYGWDLNPCWSLGGETLLNRALDEETDDAYMLLAQSFSLGRSWTERIGSFAEWFVLAPCSADTDHTQHYFDGGFTFLLSNDVQWDVEAGIGLNDAADDYFVGTGLSVRFK